MAIVSNPLIGRTSGSMGNVTFSSWKGKNVLKDKATSVANPQTDAQTAQRAAFSQMVLAFRQMPSAIRAGFKKLAVGMSEFNAFAKAVLDVAFDVSAPPAATLIPANVLISKGTIALTGITTAVPDRSLNTIVVTFPTTTDQPGQSVNDVAIIAGFNTAQQKWTGEVTTALRSTGTASIPLPAAWVTGETVQVYLGFYSPLSGESSDSDNIDALIVA